MLSKTYSGAVSTTLLTGTAATLLIALFIVLVFIMPAEYGKDPTGLGERFGVNRMSVEESKMNHNVLQSSLKKSTEVSEKIVAHTRYQQPLQFMKTDVVIDGDGSVEYKFDLQADSKINYLWSVSNGKLAYADLHGHTPGPSGKPEDEIVVQYLDTQEANSVSGEFIAPFEGEHGWYFLNLEPREITITIQASGHWDKHEMLAFEAQR